MQLNAQRAFTSTVLFRYTRIIFELSIHDLDTCTRTGGYDFSISIMRFPGLSNPWRSGHPARMIKLREGGERA